MEGHKKYRPEIDGLRAIAVIIVLLGHLNVSFFHGGFVGVDVFFVISGFLITGIIHREITQGTFSLVNFYERRIRRIIPAFYVFAFLVSLYVLSNNLPEETLNYFKSLLAALFYGSNYFFYSSTNYFDAAANTKPLLHTWSLGLEEQYYFIFPILMVFLSKKFKSSLSLILTVMLFLSAFCYLYFLAENSSLAFYSFLTRFWELLIGGLLAIGIAKQVKFRWLSEVFGLMSMVFIFYPVITISHGVLNPGPYAFLPVIGAVLLIYSNQSELNSVGRLLSLRPVVFVGKISYSLYLWHWALIVFFLEKNNMSLNTTNKAWVIFLSFLFAYLSWRFVEQPLRQKRILGERNGLFKGFALSSLTLVMMASLVIASDGWSSRFGTDFLQLRKASRNKNKLENICFSKSNGELKKQIQRLKAGEVCNQEEGPSFFLWGDSHGAAAISMVETLAKEQRKKLMVETSSGCPPILSVSRVYGDPERLCPQFNELVYQSIKRLKPERVYLIARWSTYYTGRKHDKGPLEFLMQSEQEVSKSSEDNKLLFEKSIMETIVKLKEMSVGVTLVLQPPEYLEHIPKKILSKIKNKDFNDKIGESDQWMTGKTFSENQKYFFGVNNVLKLAATGLELINLSDFLCEKEYCIIMEKGKSLYRDGNHLSNYSAGWIGQKLSVQK